LSHLSVRQQRAIEQLLTAESLTQAAVAAGISRRTLTRWLADPAFVAALEQAGSEAVANAARKLSGLSETAVEELRSILENGSTEVVRLRAIEMVLAHALRWRELADLERRVAALEEKTWRANGKGNRAEG
jgi:site-specific recombinase XerD